VRAPGEKSEEPGRRWREITPLLLYAVLADLWLAYLPSQPDYLCLVGILAVLLLAGTVIAHEVDQGRRERETGRIELRSVRRAGARCSAFVIPYPDRMSVATLMGAMVGVGLWWCAVTLTIVKPIPGLDPSPVRFLISTCLGLFVLAAAMSVRAFRRSSHYLAFLPDGVMWSVPGMGCFVPWEVIQEVRLVKFRLLGRAGPLFLGIRVTETDRVHGSVLVRRRIRYRGARGLWHCLWPIGILALPPLKLAWLVHAYATQPGERQKIGTLAELEEVRAALAQIRSR